MNKTYRVMSIMNSINSCSDTNFQKKMCTVLDILCKHNGVTFEKVQPTNGDYKNDGWIIEKNIYFAMYSPSDARVSQNNQIVTKLDGDLDGLCKHVFIEERWGKDITEFYLIVNTHDKDLPADPERLKEGKINEIKNKYDRDFVAKVISANEMKGYLLSLDNTILEEICNNLDMEMLENEFTIIDIANFVEEYTNYLVLRPEKNNEIDLKRIDIEKKIEINQLEELKDRITNLIVSSNKIDEYISFIMAEGKSIEDYNIIKDKIIMNYKNLSESLSGKDLYEELVGSMIVSEMKPSCIVIIESIIVNVFIRCDIFKKEII